MADQEEISEPQTASRASEEYLDDDDGFGSEDDFGKEVMDDEDAGGELSAEEEEGELVDEESSDDEFSPESKSYREIQSMYSKTQNKASELEGDLQQIEDRLAPLGGLDKVVQALNYVQSDPEFMALARKKQGQTIPGIDESNMTPETKEALELVKQTVRAELAPHLNQLKSEQHNLSDQVRQGKLDDIADDLLQNFGDEFAEQLPTIEKLAKTLPKEQLDNPSYKLMESLFFDSLREDGKAENYYLHQYQNKVNDKRGKSTGMPRSGNIGASMPKQARPKTMFDAMRVADKKQAFSRRRGNKR